MMIVACLARNTLEIQQITSENQALLKEAVWVDLLSPSREEEAQVERCITLEIPTPEEMQEIELSSRLYKDNDALFMTAMMIAQSDSPDLKLEPVTFVLTPQQLITIRYIETQAFKLFRSQLQKIDITHRDAISLLIELLDTIIDRLADILELVGRHLDDYSKTIFRPQLHNTAMKLDYKELLQKIGANGDLNTKARESLVTFNRLITFFGQTAGSKIDSEGHLRLASLNKDILSLSDHADFLSSEVNFLLNATLGMVSIEQNNIIKIFSVAAVIFLPPTLIASIYGMNFHNMPELAWEWGYLLAIGLMLLSSWLPYKYFKRRKWL
jgi:magnesium transporter